MTKVFIVDDHPVMREAVRDVIASDSELSVSGEAASAAEAFQRLAETEADVVLIDLSLPDISGIELARALKERQPDLRMAILSGHGESMHVRQALEAGLHGYILKGNGKEICQAVRAIRDGEQYLSEKLKSAG